jgi:hypothetical protein
MTLIQVMIRALSSTFPAFLPTFLLFTIPGSDECRNSSAFMDKLSLDQIKFVDVLIQAVVKDPSALAQWSYIRLRVEDLAEVAQKNEDAQKIATRISRLLTCVTQESTQTSAEKLAFVQTIVGQLHRYLFLSFMYNINRNTDLDMQGHE